MAERRAALRYGSLGVAIIAMVLGAVLIAAGGGFKSNPQGGYGLTYDPGTSSQIEIIGLIIFVTAIAFIAVFYFWPAFSSASSHRTEK